jgi:hypothetical protein
MSNTSVKSESESARVLKQERHHIFNCSRCEAPLADIWITKDVPELAYDFVAKCCHCGNKSYQQTVRGLFVVGQSEEGEKYTVVDGFDMDQDPCVIQTQRVSPFIKSH